MHNGEFYLGTSGDFHFGIDTRHTPWVTLTEYSQPRALEQGAVHLDRAAADKRRGRSDRHAARDSNAQPPWPVNCASVKSISIFGGFGIILGMRPQSLSGNEDVRLALKPSGTTMRMQIAAAIRRST